MTVIVITSYDTKTLDRMPIVHIACFSSQLHFVSFASKSIGPENNEAIWEEFLALGKTIWK